jgi:hypothetical protein
LRTASQRERQHWGVPELQWRLRQPDVNSSDRNDLRISDNLREFVRAAARL